MKLFFKKISVTAIILSLALSSFLFIPTVLAAPELIKATGLDTVYYLDSSGARHPFPNRATYQSWYGNDFSKVVTLSHQTLAQYPLGKNITVRPGIKILKVPSAPSVYAVEQGGVLRELKTETIATEIYGANWASRVIDLPEVFFSDYLVAEPIVYGDTLPDSILYQDEVEKKYYYLNNQVLQPFASTQAVTANYFKLTDALVGSIDGYAVRLRPINTLSKTVFNPVADNLLDRRDCDNTDLKTAFIFLAKDNYAQAQLEKIELIKAAAPNYFSWATRELSSLDTSQPTAVMLDDGYLVKDRNDGTTEINNEAIMTFYDTHADIYDFIFVFTNFEIPNNLTPGRIAYFVPVTNIQQGIGKVSQDRSNSYGSAGKLKGIIVMGNVSQYNINEQSELDRTLSVVVHELLHQWGVSVSYAEDGYYQYDLISQDQNHWSNYASFISPLGGSGWIDNGDGTFTSGLLYIDANKRQYSDIDLYLMGLLPKQVIKPIVLLMPEDLAATGNTISATTKQISINQIIRALDNHQCGA